METSFALKEFQVPDGAARPAPNYCSILYSGENNLQAANLNYHRNFLTSQA
jgi:hypothetical protein